MRAIARRLSEQYPDTNRDIAAVVVPIREEVLGDTRVQVIALMTAAAAIVLIACANLASLLLARASVRRGDTRCGSRWAPRADGWRGRCSSKRCACQLPAACWGSQSRC